MRIVYNNLHFDYNETLLGIFIDKKLSLKEHGNECVNKASRMCA